ncbi:flagellin [Novilysobacter selenitireducens]|uniref:Flagellin n=1 Tax=Novilysobacter selenitireducens TaxID=2872639 RepID=A0ABS7TA27_9GAMM|nr:flagellin [Lysobacter selenitireducens]MBZ4040680.1 flagellin [Lysobacter selenitireducens]
MQVINSNIMSLNAQRNLSNTGADLATSLQRLSSGLRINSAKDDAAGLAISERFTTQIRGMDQAARNANDGISLAQTAEGAMGEIGNNLQRIRELAVQSRNATNSASDREALNKEAQQLKAEIDRVATQTSFNGVKLLDGSFQDQTFQVGANQGETITVSEIANASSAALGEWTSADTVSAQADGAALADQTGGAQFAAIGSGDLVINGTEITLAASAADATGADQAADLLAAINGAGIAGVTAALNDDGDGVVLTSADDIVIEATAGGTASSGLADGTVAAATVAGTDQTGFAALDISTAAGADNAMLAMDAALNALNTARADMGAVQNRFSSVVANLSSNSENLSAARSRIQDADFAKETAQLTRNQILQQAGTAMLAQANQAPQGVLSLLR